MKDLCKYSLFCFVLFGCGAATTSSTTSSSSTSKFEISKCVEGDPGTYMKAIVRLENNSYTNSIEVGTSNTCASGMAKIERIMTVTAPDSAKFQKSTSNTGDVINYTPLTQAITAAANTSSLCGLTNWEINKTVQIPESCAQNGMISLPFLILNNQTIPMPMPIMRGYNGFMVKSSTPPELAVADSSTDNITQAIMKSFLDRNVDEYTDSGLGIEFNIVK